MNRLGTAVVGLAFVGLVSGCSAMDAFSSPPAKASSVTSESSHSSSAAASTSGTTASSTPAAPSTAAPVVVSGPPIAPPTKFSGNGNTVLSITKPAGASAVIATIIGNAAARNFDVRAIDGAQDHLVATTSYYVGSTLLDPSGTNTHQLRVHGVGPWSIKLTDVRAAPAFTVGYRGTGDGVILHTASGGAGVVSVQGAGPFLIRTYRLGGVTALVNETGPWSGTVRWPEGAAIVTVRATGPWSISVDHR